LTKKEVRSGFGGVNGVPSGKKFENYYSNQLHKLH